MIIDIDAIPPEGVSVIITNTTVAGSNSPVDIEEGAEGSGNKFSLAIELAM